MEGAVPVSGGDAYAGGYCGLIAVVLLVVAVLVFGFLVFVGMTLIIHSAR